MVDPWMVLIEMVVSIEELRMTAMNLRKEGLNSQQIADELSLSQDTISWLLAGSKGEEMPSDVRIGWRTIGVRPTRISAVGTIMADVADEELGFDNIDTIVGISINGISFAHEVARILDCEFTVFRTTDIGDGSGSLSNKYGQVSGKKVVIIDDVLSTGKTMVKTIKAIKAAGGEVGLVIVLVNKTMRNEIEDVPLRGVIRAVSV
ncbi:MAG TPA: orotate phosphoribosyltransferase-like protein [Candidatus Poseidoniales archaeon]|nr:orotate phosphoribosyltransferase-like protein [Euryarchaeota archaeon]DAC26129.1 MAG TPA: orotate phosphoribosyltransferase-like protein [Candidatus Poseidoniales archaeon]HII58738.1 orotate phosphoribosyltransferase-like protein [Candidatus Poseidoniaceae archaeon]|tara:strand:+ start:5197 stop:5811 length:615 start_codon:yes stop_codon:yes gene_type:complete